MNKHEEMRIKVSIWSREARQDMRKYIDEHEATEKAYEELVRDVKRYWEVKTSFKDIKEYELLKEKLQKVGNENE